MTLLALSGRMQPACSGIESDCLVGTGSVGGLLSGDVGCCCRCGTGTVALKSVPLGSNTEGLS